MRMEKCPLDWGTGEGLGRMFACFRKSLCHTHTCGLPWDESGWPEGWGLVRERCAPKLFFSKSF